MSGQVKDTLADPEELKTSDDENPEKTMSQPSPSDDVLTQYSIQGSETTCEDPAVRASTPKSVQSNGTTDRDRLTPSEWESDEFFSASEWQEQKRQAGKKKSGLSARMEYLARPKKDFLDRVGFERFDGVLPEKSLPSWHLLPLPTKLPVAGYPYEITMTKLSENVYLAPPGEKMDLRDENNLRPPMKVYHSLNDPHLKAHFNKKEIRKHLKKDGYVSKSGKVVCSLEDINEYREYTRRILAERIQQIYRDQQEEQKKEYERRMKKKFDEEEEKLRNTRAQTNLRSYIKNAVSSIQEGSMESQRERDRKVLNKQIRLQAKWKQSAQAKQERYEHVFQQHISEKYEREEKKRLMELELARLDVEHIEELCRKREKERLDRRQKLEDFWLRKAEEQIAWVEKGLELEKKWFEDREAKIAWRKTQAVAPHIKRQTPKAKRSKSEEIDNRIIDEILKEEEAALTLDAILRQLTTVVPKEDDHEEEQVEDSMDKSVTDVPESFVDNDTKKPSSEEFTISVEQDQKTVTEETQPEQNLSIEGDSPEEPKSSEKLKEEEESNEFEDVKNVLESIYQNLSEKGKLDGKLSSSSSVIKKFSPEGKESEQKSSPDESSSEQNAKEKSIEEQPSREVEDFKDKAVMAEPESFIRSDTEESKSDEIKQEDQNSENSDPK
ncbi:hypothetical protein AVEN_164560-1 [Araneus ventricosus]|uniref:Fibrous sheath-interacting protein 2 n=1 Tax=Araneus ventricosus TaxID=182803 RepID=A0A4Y2B2H2_ARAVE|nr:hypothetical protein AVEN_164560-1 [Araneus ventricosus]